MKRIFLNYAYGPGPREGCWWDETCDLPSGSVLEGDLAVDVAVIGAGFTGLSAAFQLAQAGTSVAVLDAQSIGWGASGRNGGFCCLGGGMVEDGVLDRNVGKAARLEWRATERAAVEYVSDLITGLGADVDRHSQGETLLAHRAKDMDNLRQECARIAENYGVVPQLIEWADLPEHGLSGPFYGGLTIPIGFGLNPRKYLNALARAAVSFGAQVYENCPVLSITRSSRGRKLDTPHGSVRADRVIIATNGYSSDDLPRWMAGRYMPAQSNVLVTRPLEEEELRTAGWTSDQMAFDTRNLLHYFRLMPDRRFLFGMRGGLMSGPGAEARARRAVRSDFERMFPAWAHVPSSHAWSGLVCLARDRLPFFGPIPGDDRLLAGLCYHGNGVAMGSFAGALLADLILDRSIRTFPEVMRRPLARFPLGRWRRVLMPPVYAALTMSDL